MEDETISDHTGQRFDLFAKRRGIEAVWAELDVI